MRYYSCENYNKNSKIESNKKLCDGKIIIDMVKETAFITKLHSNECLENSFGKITIMPSLNEEITKREQIMNFADKILALNPAIPLPSFKETIYRICTIKKYKLNISEQYLKNYFYNWKNKNRINTFYFAHDNPTTLDGNIFLQNLTEKIFLNPRKKSK